MMEPSDGFQKMDLGDESVGNLLRRARRPGNQKVIEVNLPLEILKAPFR